SVLRTLVFHDSVTSDLYAISLHDALPILLLQTVMLVEAALLAWLTLTARVTVEWIWALALAFGLATAFEVPTRQSYLVELVPAEDRKSTRLNSSHAKISYAVFCLKKKIRF